jgi:hypothetical protein
VSLAEIVSPCSLVCVARLYLMLNVEIVVHENNYKFIKT